MNQINLQEERRGSYVNFNSTNKASTPSVHNPAKDNNKKNNIKKKTMTQLTDEERRGSPTNFNYKGKWQWSKTNLQQSQFQTKKKEEDDPIQSTDGMSRNTNISFYRC